MVYKAKFLRNRAGNVVLPVLVTVVLGAGVVVMNTLVARNNFHKIDNRTLEIIAFPQAEVAAWQSFYYSGPATGAIDASGRFPVSLENDYSKNIPALPTAFPPNYTDGTPLNLAQTIPYDPGRTLLSRVTTDTYRYQPTEIMPTGTRNCGYLSSFTRNTGFNQCLVKTVPPSLCPVGVCTPAIQACIANTEAKTPISITNETQLLAMQSGNYYKLTANITMTKTTQLTLANIVFDGNGYKISKLASRDASGTLGLFKDLNCAVIKNLIMDGNNVALVASGGYFAQTITNVALLNIRLNSGNFSIKEDPTKLRPAGLVARAKDSVFNQVYVKVNISFGDLGSLADMASGVVGVLEGVNSTMTDVTFDGKIDLSANPGLADGFGNVVSAGGLVGVQLGGAIVRGKVTSAVSFNLPQGDKVGGITALLVSGSITDSTFSGTSSGVWSMGGGIAGRIDKTLAATYGVPNPVGSVSVTIQNCASYSPGFSGTLYNGGLVGGVIAYSGDQIEIRQSTSTAKLTFAPYTTYLGGGYYGGLVGFMICNGTCVISDSYSKSAVNMGSAPNGVGGIVGLIQKNAANPSGAVSIQNSYAAGSCTNCNQKSGGVGATTGSQPTITATSNFYDSSSWPSDNFFIGKTPTELQSATTFPNTWDFNNIWTLPVGSNPKLKWEP